MKRVAVIGAGPSGLATLKALLEEGHDPVGFERAKGVGGAFRYDEQDGIVWETCRLTSSGLLTAFSDFPVADRDREHMPVGRYVAYLERYAERFGLLRRIRFATSVERVRRTPDGSWCVTSRSNLGCVDERFDAVAVCSGLHQHPHEPTFPGRETFAGTIRHGSQYRRGAEVSGKRVLIVGAGESGADVIDEVSRHATETVVSIRRGVAAVSRRSLGVPRDWQTSRLLNTASPWIFQTRNPIDDRKRRVYRWSFVPVVVVDKILQILYRTFWETIPLFLEPTWTAVKTNLATRRMTMELLAESGGTVMEQFGTKDDAFVRALATGRCRRAPAIERFDGERVVFADGSAWRPDVVLLCTGFRPTVPYLADGIDAEIRYLETFPCSSSGDLAFIGFARPAFGAMPPVAELQARWFALITSGARSLPEPCVRRERAMRDREARVLFFRAIPDLIPHLVDHTSFCDRLAAEIGCKPTRADLRRQSRRFRRRFVDGPFVSAQYRLVGPHADPEVARAVIEGLPVAHAWPDRMNLRLRGALSRLLHRWLGESYRPRLLLD